MFLTEKNDKYTIQKENETSFKKPEYYKGYFFSERLMFTPHISPCNQILLKFLLFNAISVTKTVLVLF